ncbi:MAG: hypothetical protein A4E66_00376 [Syntrophus sp. PtaB.Bin001]|nr:MAG: hypothetical protein A4E66_00376 [Syntrophus sp. PtaB.Bin001]
MKNNRKSNKSTWSDVKAALTGMDKKQLTGLISDLYGFSKENQAFLHARFTIGSDTLAPYKKTIRDCMYPDIDKNRPIEISKAKKAISNYTKAVGNLAGEAELMTFFVECGNRFTLDYGDINEAFYDALNLMYRHAIDKVLSLPAEKQKEFQDRLKAIMTSSSNIGWGYHDELCEDYYEAFSQVE